MFGSSALPEDQSISNPLIRFLQFAYLALFIGRTQITLSKHLQIAEIRNNTYIDVIGENVYTQRI